MAALDVQIRKAEDRSRLETGVLIQARDLVQAVQEALQTADNLTGSSREMVAFLQTQLTQFESFVRDQPLYQNELAKVQAEYRRAVVAHQTNRFLAAVARIMDPVSRMLPAALERLHRP